MNGGGACLHLCTKVKDTSRNVKLSGDQVDDSHYEIVGEDNRSKDNRSKDKEVVTIAVQQYGFMPGRSTTDAIFCLRMLLEKWTEGQKAVDFAFIDLEKAYDRVPREELWECLRLAETSECYIKIIKDMYDGATKTVRSAAGLTEEFELDVGIHQGSALGPFLFAIIIDRLTEDIRKDAPWDMLFADGIVLSRKNHREPEKDLEIWRNALERRGLKVSLSKTEYLRVEGVDGGKKLKLQG